MFIDQQSSRSRRLINLAHVVLAERSPAGSGPWRLTTTQGDELDVDNTSFSIALSSSPATSFPAAPGTSIIWCWEEDGDWQLGRQTVVGWIVNQDGELTPLTLDVEATIGNYFIEHPSGRVEAGKSLESWANADDFMQSQRVKTGGAG